MTNQAEVMDNLTNMILEEEFGGAPEKEPVKESEEDHIQDPEEDNQEYDLSETEDFDEAQYEEPEEEEVNEFFTIKHDGEERQVNKAEAVELAQKGYDYTKKTQKLSDERKNLEKANEAFREEVAFTQQFNKEVVALEIVNQQLQQFQQVDWNRLFDEEPLDAPKLQQQFINLKDRRADMINHIGQLRNEFTQKRQNSLSERQKLVNDSLQGKVKGWTDSTRQEIISFAKELGAEDSDMIDYAPAWVYEALHDAKKYRSLKSNKLGDKKVRDLPKVSKPGTRKSKADAQAAKVKEVKSKLRKTKSARAAADLLADFID